MGENSSAFTGGFRLWDDPEESARWNQRAARKQPRRPPKLVPVLTDDSYVPVDPLRRARTLRSHPMPELNDPDIYQTVLDALETGVYIVDRNRRIRFWNQGAEQITGYLRQDVVGRFLRDHLLITGDDAKNLDSDPDDPINLAVSGRKTLDSSMFPSSTRMDTGFPSSYEPTRFETTTAQCWGSGKFRKESARPRIRRDASPVLRRFWLFGRGYRSCGAKFHGNTTPREFDHVRRTQHSLRDSSSPGRSLEQHRARRGPGVVPTILRIVAQSIENCVRPTDRFGCWGKNQFLAILLECRESEVSLVGERVRRMIGRVGD